MLDMDMMIFSVKTCQKRQNIYMLPESLSRASCHSQGPSCHRLGVLSTRVDILILSLLCTSKS